MTLLLCYMYTSGFDFADLIELNCRKRNQHCLNVV
jgi:hypothetical protein